MIDGDGDFGFEETFFNSIEGEQREFYFEKREDAVKVINESFHSLNSTFHSHSMDHIKRWISSFDHRIELITKKLPTFSLEKSFGNQDIIYRLEYIRKIDLPQYGAVRYKSSPVAFDFSWYEEEHILWDEFVNLDDVKEGD